ncbi:Ig-like domain-containing protein [Paenibacillus sp. MER TA 81-3]|uniref:Ig-like domain-containing protein n=1 Tax=Paenibacillus sp. MER TA 81-3 TaxID=2939573 RepID=UPI00203E8EB1|nr:Ig-like domain-containing protein [Paenibacillus sp. MER TA 81-3]MCM3341052.1 Ig-like domain-containing protein [Paenibacillus sp. MER TA 81-3]
METSDRNKNGGALYFDELRVFYGDTDVYELILNGLTPMQVGETKRVNVLATYSGSKEPIDVTSDAQLASSDPAVAQVNLDGSVTALKEGTAHITARYRQASTAEYELAVGVEAPAAPRWTAAHVMDKGIHLAWQDNKDSDAGYYVLYRTVGSSTPNVNDPSQIVLTLCKSGGPLLFTDTSAVTGETYTYAVTAVDRLHNESVPSDPIII